MINSGIADQNDPSESTTNIPSQYGTKIITVISFEKRSNIRLIIFVVDSKMWYSQ
jgi:hypothetical protein